jgi:hypothetical protein
MKQGFSGAGIAHIQGISALDHVLFHKIP